MAGQGLTNVKPTNERKSEMSMETRYLIQIRSIEEEGWVTVKKTFDPFRAENLETELNGQYEFVRTIEEEVEVN